MKVLAKDLQKALKRLEKVVCTKKTLPVLQHVRMAVFGEPPLLVLTATDLETFIEAGLEVEEPAPCDRLLPFKDLKAAAEVAENAVAIVPGEVTRVGSVPIKTMPGEEFPAAPPVGSVQMANGQATELARALKAVVIAASTEPSRLAIRTVLWEAHAGLFVSTDGHRLHVVLAPGLSGTGAAEVAIAGGKLDVLLDRDAVVKLLPCLENGEAHLALSPDRRLVEASGRYWRWVTKAVDMTFPNWRQVMPKEGRVLGLLRKALLDSCTRALKVHKASDQLIPTLMLTEHGATLDAVLDRGHEPPVPCGRLELDATERLPKDEVFSLNARYLHEALSAMPGDVVFLQFTDPMAPVLFWSAPEWMQAVIMPVRVGEHGWRIGEDGSVVRIDRPGRKPKTAEDKAGNGEEQEEGEPEGEDEAATQEGSAQ